MKEHVTRHEAAIEEIDAFIRKRIKAGDVVDEETPDEKKGKEPTECLPSSDAITEFFRSHGLSMELGKQLATSVGQMVHAGFVCADPAMLRHDAAAAATPLGIPRTPKTPPQVYEMNDSDEEMEEVTDFVEDGTDEDGHRKRKTVTVKRRRIGQLKESKDIESIEDSVYIIPSYSCSCTSAS